MGRWVRVHLGAQPDDRDVILRVDGEGLLVTAVIADTVLGRLWTDAPPGALLKGGRGDVIVVPRSWLTAPLDLLIEATGSGTSVLEALLLGGSVDLPEADAAACR